MKKRIYLSPPFIGEKEKKMLFEAVESNWIAPVGPDINLFEEEMINYLNGHYHVLYLLGQLHYILL